MGKRFVVTYATRKLNLDRGASYSPAFDYYETVADNELHAAQNFGAESGRQSIDRAVSAVQLNYGFPPHPTGKIWETGAASGACEQCETEKSDGEQIPLRHHECVNDDAPRASLTRSDRSSGSS